MAEILTTLVKEDGKLAFEIKRDGILLAQALLDRSEVDRLIATLEHQRRHMDEPDKTQLSTDDSSMR